MSLSGGRRWRRGAPDTRSLGDVGDKLILSPNKASTIPETKQPLDSAAVYLLFLRLFRSLTWPGQHLQVCCKRSQLRVEPWLALPTVRRTKG